jgi:cytochrome c oxidase accessory protein FixG
MTSDPSDYQHDHRSHLASVDAKGHQKRIHPLKQTGKYTSRKNVIFAFFFILWAVLPWIRINHLPAVLFDLPNRTFYLLGERFNAKEAWLGFFVISGLAFSLFVISALWGRLWCGYACPYSVLLEGVFRPIEIWLEGSPSERRKRDEAGYQNWTRADWLIKTKKTLFFVILSSVFAHLFVAYFVPYEELFGAFIHGPKGFWTAFTWANALTIVFYFVFSRFREQLCLAICPYGRLQGVLADQDTMIIGYDLKRGEPRSKGARKKSESSAQIPLGACIDCKKCVAVCPTGIDIRNGTQLECVGCAACIDACDEIMVQIGQEPGLIRYDSLKGLNGEKRRLIRPRLFIYLFAGLLGLSVATYAYLSNLPFSSILLRMPGSPYQIVGEDVVNAFELKLENKRSTAMHIKILPNLPEGLTLSLPIPEIEIPATKTIHLPLMIASKKEKQLNHVSFEIKVQTMDGKQTKEKVLKMEYIGLSKSKSHDH